MYFSWLCSTYETYVYVYNEHDIMPQILKSPQLDYKITSNWIAHA